MNVAVILAGGTGKRLGSELPKQFLEIAGKTVIEHTIDAFEKSESIDEIIVVIHSSFLEKMEVLTEKNEWKKVKKILPGGAERYDSSLVAIRIYAGKNDVRLIFHDAVRPLVSERIIRETVEALDKYGAVGVAIPAVDTMLIVEDCFIRHIPDRSKLMRAQTPQGFRLPVIEKAYRLALKDPDFQVTDDCGVVLKYLPEEPIYIVQGEETNIKLTYKEDIYLLEKLLQLRSSL